MSKVIVAANSNPVLAAAIKSAVSSEAVKITDSPIVVKIREALTAAGCDAIIANRVASSVEGVAKAMVKQYVTKASANGSIEKAAFAADISKENLANMIAASNADQDRWDSTWNNQPEEVKALLCKEALHSFNEATKWISKTHSAFVAAKESGNWGEFMDNPTTLGRNGILSDFVVAYNESGKDIVTYDGKAAFSCDNIIAILCDGFDERVTERSKARGKEKNILALYEMKNPDGIVADLRAAAKAVPKLEDGRTDYSSNEYRVYSKLRGEEVKAAAEAMSKPDLVKMHDTYMGLSWIHNFSKMKSLLSNVAIDKYNGWSDDIVIELYRFYLRAKDYRPLLSLFGGDDALLRAYAIQLASLGTGVTEAQRTAWKNEQWYKDIDKKFNVNVLDVDTARERLVCKVVYDTLRHFECEPAEQLDASDSVKYGCPIRNSVDAQIELFDLIAVAEDKSSDKKKDPSNIAQYTRRNYVTGEDEKVNVTTAAIFGYIGYLVDANCEFLDIDIPDLLGYKNTKEYQGFCEWREDLDVKKELLKLHIQDLAENVKEGKINRLVGDVFGCLVPSRDTDTVIYDDDGIGYHSIMGMIAGQIERDPKIRLEVVTRSEMADQKNPSARAMSEFFNIKVRESDSDSANERMNRAAVSAVIQKAMANAKFRDTLAMIATNKLEFVDSEDDYSAYGKLKAYRLSEIYKAVGELIVSGNLPTIDQMASAEKAKAETAEADNK